MNSSRVSFISFFMFTAFSCLSCNCLRVTASVNELLATSILICLMLEMHNLAVTMSNSYNFSLAIGCQLQSLINSTFDFTDITVRWKLIDNSIDHGSHIAHLQCTQIVCILHTCILHITTYAYTNILAIYPPACICIYTHVHTHSHTHTQQYTHLDTRTYTQSDTYTHTHAHTHTLSGQSGAI